MPEGCKERKHDSMFLHGADKIRYGYMKRTLAQNVSMGTNKYPRKTEDALNIIIAYSQTMQHHKKGKPQKKNDALSERAFVQTGCMTQEKRDIQNVTSCGKEEHNAKDYEKKEKEHLHANVAYSKNKESNYVEHIFHQNILGSCQDVVPIG